MVVTNAINGIYIYIFVVVNVTFCVATLALGLRPRQRGCKVAGQEEGRPRAKAKALQDCGLRGRKPGSQGKGIARLRAKRKEARESRQRHCKVVGQEEARESHHILPGM